MSKVRRTAAWFVEPLTDIAENHLLQTRTIQSASSTGCTTLWRFIKTAPREETAEDYHPPPASTAYCGVLSSNPPPSREGLGQRRGSEIWVQVLPLVVGKFTAIHQSSCGCFDQMKKDETPVDHCPVANERRRRVLYVVSR